MLKVNLSTGRRLIVDYDECLENPRDLYGCESRLIVLDCLYRSWGADEEMCAADLSREVKAARRNGCKVFPVYTDGSSLSTSSCFASCICLSAKQIGALIFPKGTKDARKQAQSETASSLAAAEEAIEKKKQAADEDIALQAEKAKKQLKGEVVDMAISASSALLSREVDGDDERKLLDDFLAKLEEK